MDDGSGVEHKLEKRSPATLLMDEKHSSLAEHQLFPHQKQADATATPRSTFWGGKKQGQTFWMAPHPAR